MQRSGGPGMIGAPYFSGGQDGGEENWASPGHTRSRYTEGTGSPTGWGASSQRRDGGPSASGGWGNDSGGGSPSRQTDGWAPGWQAGDDDDDRPGFKGVDNSPSKRGQQQDSAGNKMRRGHRQGATSDDTMVIDDMVEEFNDDDLEDDFGFAQPKKKDNWQPKDQGGSKGGGGGGEGQDNGDDFRGFGDNMGGKQRNNLFGQQQRGGRANDYNAAAGDDGDTSEEEYREDTRAPGRQKQQERGQRQGEERRPPRDGGKSGGNKFASDDLSVEEIRRQVRSSKNTQGLKDGVMKAMPGSTQGKTGWYHTTSDGDILVAYFHLGNGNWTQISRAIPLDSWEQLLSKPEQERLDKLEANFAMNNMANELFSGGDNKGKGQGEASSGQGLEERRDLQGDAGSPGAASSGGSPNKKYELDYASDMKGFLTRALPKAQGILHCYVVRHKSALSPCYTMYLEDGNVFALFAKKMPKNMTLHYRISMEQGMSNKNDDGFLGKLRATKRKTEFCLYDHGLRPKDIKSMESRLPAEAKAALHKQEELCGVTFNAIGYQSSQTKHHMYVTMPEVHDGHHKPWLPDDHVTSSGSDTGFTMLDQYANNNENPHQVGLMGMMQKPPVLNRETGRYAQNFHGRVTAASIKNVQLCAQGDPEQDVIFQFGRVGPDRFTCDFQWPLSPLQAFSIALTRFHYK